MEKDGLVIAQTGLSAEALKGRVALVIGAGGGMGYEAARALLWLQGLDELSRQLSSEPGNPALPSLPLEKLGGYYTHLMDLARGYEKDADKLAENLRIVRGWQTEVEDLVKALKN